MPFSSTPSIPADTYGRYLRLVLGRELRSGGFVDDPGGGLAKAAGRKRAKCLCPLNRTNHSCGFALRVLVRDTASGNHDLGGSSHNWQGQSDRARGLHINRQYPAIFYGHLIAIRIEASNVAIIPNSDQRQVKLGPCHAVDFCRWNLSGLDSGINRFCIFCSFHGRISTTSHGDNVDACPCVKEKGACFCVGCKVCVVHRNTFVVHVDDGTLGGPTRFGAGKHL
mmetsp:Transcript_44579/g.100685  ORF Transcript_44579/g.100685 Transcript_44579/m.100685 type:complete len:224 (+) Transcript_44579:111-782(+)